MQKQTASFSAHVSRSAMGRYLRDSLPADQAQQIETHFQHCPQCSGNLTEYIQNEEPENQKAYHKKIKGKLKQESSIKKKLLSPFQVKMFRSGAAVIALLIFSFFAIKTVMNKKVADSAAPSGAVAITQPAKPAPAPKKASPAAVKKETPTKNEQSAADKAPPVASPKKKPAPAKPKATPKKQAPKVEPAPETPATAPVVEKPTSQPTPKKKQEPEEASKPVEQKPIEKIAPLPTLEKLDATQNSIPAPPANPL